MARYTTKRKPQTAAKQNLLPLWLVLGGLALLLLAAFGLFASNRPSIASANVKGRPNLQVDHEKVDHGNVKLSTTIEDVVKVTNTGDQPLRFIEKPYIKVLEGC